MLHHNIASEINEASEGTDMNMGEYQQGHVSRNGLRQRPAKSEGNDESPAPARDEKPKHDSRKLVLAYLNLIADGVHNFTDGMAIGAAFIQGGAPLGWARATIILFHELPQELGDYGMLLAAGMSSGRALAWNFVSVCWRYPPVNPCSSGMPRYFKWLTDFVRAGTHGPAGYGTGAFLYEWDL
jgi:zinc transporter ZupT